MPDRGKVYVRNGFIRNISGGESQKGYEEEEDEEELSSGGCLIHRSTRETISSARTSALNVLWAGNVARDVSMLRQQCCARLRLATPDSALASTPHYNRPSLNLRLIRRLCPQWRMTLHAWSFKPIPRLLVILNTNAPTTVTLLPAFRAIRSCWTLSSTTKTREMSQILLLQVLTLCRSRRAIYICLARLRRWPVHPNCLFRPTASLRAGPLIKTTLRPRHHNLLANPRRFRVGDGDGRGRKSGS
jgi:hypothetical protein